MYPRITTSAHCFAPLSSMVTRYSSPRTYTSRQATSDSHKQMVVTALAPFGRCGTRSSRRCFFSIASRTSYDFSSSYVASKWRFLAIGKANNPACSSRAKNRFSTAFALSASRARQKRGVEHCSLACVTNARSGALRTACTAMERPSLPPRAPPWPRGVRPHR